MTAAASLAVRRLSVNISVAHDHPAPERVGQSLQAVAEKRLVPALCRVLEPLDRAERSDVVLIRQLELELELDAGMDPDELARRWAAAIAGALVRAIAAPESANGVVSFSSPAAHLARFLADLLAGSAWTKWYHRRFAGLKPLLVPVAIRTALLDEPLAGITALSELELPVLGGVIEAAGAVECRRIVQRLRELEASSESPSAARAVFDSEARAARCVPEAGAGYARMLAWIALALSAADPAPADAPPVLSAIVELVESLSIVRALVPATELEIARARERLARWSPELQRLRESAEPAHDARPLEPLWTAIGAPCLLMRGLGELSWPDGEAGALGRLLVLAEACGEERRARVIADSVAQSLSGVEPAWVTSDAIEHAAQSINVKERANAILARFIGGLPGFSESSFAYAWTNFLDVDAELRLDEHGWVAELRRPPLHALLTLIGAFRGAIELPWLGTSLRLKLRP